MNDQFSQHTDEQEILQLLRNKGRKVQGLQDLDVLIGHMAGRNIVMMGEASHGTHEYYVWRSYLTRRLVAEHGFRIIAVEGDWPGCFAINRFIRHKGQEAQTTRSVLQQFDRWPTWMWANWEVAALTEWLHQYNKGKDFDQQAGFYGLDVYSLWDSLHAVHTYLEQTDAEALRQAEKAFRCFAPYRDDETSYAYAAQVVPQRCVTEVVQLLQHVRQQHSPPATDPEEQFSAEQNALIAVNAEHYYCTMIQGGAASWNVRDSHMAETLERLLRFHGPHTKAIVWEHNTHIGDARATTMADEGMYNLGELARKKFGIEGVFLLGLGSYTGTVIAAKNWGAPMEVMEVPEARTGSWEELLHRAGGNRLLFSEDLHNSILSEQTLGHRAIGVVYRPQYERHSNYVRTSIPDRYDAFLHIDTTRALHPLHAEPHNHKMPDTYPFGT